MALSKATGYNKVEVIIKFSTMTSNSAFACIFLICVISCTKEHLADSYLTPLVNRWSQYTGSAFRGQMSALPSRPRACDNNEPSERIFDQLETMRRKALSAVLLSCMFSSISEMTLVGGCCIKFIILASFCCIFLPYFFYTLCFFMLLFDQLL
jgi:hypothetical protein